jgi:prevent-host-death family protein
MDLPPSIAFGLAGIGGVRRMTLEGPPTLALPRMSLALARPAGPFGGIESAFQNVALVLSSRMGRTVGLRELRQDASELVRRVEAGEEIDITVAGRLAARLVPARPQRWRRWDDIAALFNGPPDPAWERDRAVVDQSVNDPWPQT